MEYATDEIGISPRTSVDLGSGHPALEHTKGSPTKPSNNLDSSNEDHAKRKDSHFHGIMQTKEQVSTDMEANTREQTSDEHPRRGTTLILRSIDWIRQRHASSSRSSSNSSSSSDSPLSSPIIQPARTVRRAQGTTTDQIQPAAVTRRMASTQDDTCMEPRLDLPPGFEIPGEGQAGPADWLHRSWEEHYRRSAEFSHRACHPLAAARCLPVRAEELQRYRVASICQEDSQCIPAQRVQSIPYPTEFVTKTWDFATDRKGKGRRYVENVSMEDGRGRVETRDTAGAAESPRERRESSKGACVTTVTLDECDFAKELGQSVT